MGFPLVPLVFSYVIVSVIIYLPDLLSTGSPVMSFVSIGASNLEAIST